MSIYLHPSAFVETVGCTGPHYQRSQPSRESAGVLLNACQDKYVTEFELPYRNIQRYINEMDSNWDKLSDKDKNAVIQQLYNKIPQLQSRTPTKQAHLPHSRMKDAEKFTQSDENGSCDTGIIVLIILIALVFIGLLIYYCSTSRK